MHRLPWLSFCSAASTLLFLLQPLLSFDIVVQIGRPLNASYPRRYVHPARRDTRETYRAWLSFSSLPPLAVVKIWYCPVAEVFLWPPLDESPPCYYSSDVSPVFPPLPPQPYNGGALTGLRLLEIDGQDGHCWASVGAFGPSHRVLSTQKARGSTITDVLREAGSAPAGANLLESRPRGARSVRCLTGSLDDHATGLPRALASLPVLGTTWPPYWTCACTFFVACICVSTPSSGAR